MKSGDDIVAKENSCSVMITTGRLREEYCETWNTQISLIFIWSSNNHKELPGSKLLYANWRS